MAFIRSAFKGMSTFFMDVAEENSTPSVSQRYSDFVASASNRASSLAEIETVRLISVLSPKGSLVASVAIRVESGNEMIVQIPGFTASADGGETESLRSLHGQSVVPLGTLDQHMQVKFDKLARSLVMSTSLGALHLGAAAYSETCVSYVEQVEAEAVASRGGSRELGAAGTQGKVPLVATALGTSTIMSSIGLAPTTCESFSSYVSSMSAIHAGADGPVDESNISAILKHVGSAARKADGVVAVVSVNPLMLRALKKLKGMDTSSDSSGEMFLREFAQALSTIAGVSSVLVVALDGVTLLNVTGPRIVLCDAQLRTPRDAPRGTTVNAGVDVSSLRTVSEVVAAASYAGVLVIPPQSPLSSAMGAPLAVGLRDVAIVSIRQPFADCIDYLNAMAAIGNREFVGASAAQLLADAEEATTEESIVERRSSMRRRVSRRRKGTSISEKGDK
uniref:Uncharacterized protein n=1 Tax=Sexangularia sp. CB-2014 TaxID=1486929 RepID=A0A7S1V8I8_9EUKA